MTYKIDLFAIFIFLGIVQGIFLSFLFLSKLHRDKQANFFQGLLLVSMSLCMLEIFLMYSGYIIHCLYLVDFSEPLSFIIGPAFYLMVLSTTRGQLSKKYFSHFAFALVYLILVMPFFSMPEDVKYNAWVESYHLDLPFRDYEDLPSRIFWITDHHTELTLISVVLYGMMALIEVIRIFRFKKESFSRTENPVLKNLRNGIIQIGFITLLILVIKWFNPNDTGDHIFAAYITVTIYSISFRVMKQSGFFQQTSVQGAERYKNSSINEIQQQQVLQQLHHIMIREKPFLRPDFSLPELAQHVGTSVHVMSQVINVGLGKSFFEMTAEYRVEEAKKLLKEKKNIKVEEIAEQVGYHSKSSFNTAFKKLTGKTPSEYRAKGK